MKIGIFTDSYKPYTSGVVTSIATFRQELTRMGHDIYVFAPSYPHYNEKEDRVYRVVRLVNSDIRYIPFKFKLH